MKNLIILMVSLGLAFGVTVPKLYKMAQIKAWIPGATTRQETITQKWHQTPEEHRRRRNVYWIAWSDTEIRDVGDHRLNVDEEVWDKLAVGDQIEVVRLPNDPWPYLRNDVFTSTGNFVFDFILLVAEIGVAVGMAVGLVRDRRNEVNVT